MNPNTLKEKAVSCRVFQDQHYRKLRWQRTEKKRVRNIGWVSIYSELIEQFLLQDLEFCLCSAGAWLKFAEPSWTGSWRVMTSARLKA